LASNQHNVIKRGLLGIILLFLSLVMLQDLFEIKKVKPLYGYFIPAPDTVFTWQNWQKGKFQVTREQFLQEGFSFREDYVRLHNSIQFGLFKSTDVDWIVFGNHNQLMSKDQINAYLGVDSMSQKEINRNAYFIKALQDTLSKIGKRLYVAIPPNKVEIFPENLPSSYPEKSLVNNYEHFKRTFDQKNVDYIDFVSFFKQLKDKGDKYLFPKNGSHWNYYGSAKALQYLIEHINRSSPLKADELVITNTYFNKENGGDPDIFVTLNLLKDRISDTTLYPDVRINKNSSKKPRTIFITDSYFNNWIDHGIYDVMDSVTYYFYNDRIINEDRTETKKKFSPEELLQQYDMYILMCSETNLKEFSWGFVEQMYYYFYPESPNRAYYDQVFRKKVYKQMREIKKDLHWVKRIKDKAERNQKDLNQQLYEEAVSILLNEKKQ
jgi:hypothetical protein